MQTKLSSLISKTHQVSEKHSLALLCFFTTTGLLMVVADVFTNTVPMPAGLRDFWLVICITTFGLLLIGITLFFLSYKSTQTRPRH
jgi:hypothetical protein